MSEIFDSMLLNALYYGSRSAINSGLNIQMMKQKIITFDDFLDLTEEDIGTAEMDDYLIEVVQNLEDLRNDR